MFEVSGHLYRPLLSSQSWELGGKILGGFGTHPPTFLGAGLSILVFFWHLSPAGSTMWRGLKNRSDTYSFALWAPRTPFAYMPTLIYFGVGSREGEPWPLRPHLLQKGFVGRGGLQVPHLVLKIHPRRRRGRCQVST